MIKGCRRRSRSRSIFCEMGLELWMGNGKEGLDGDQNGISVGYMAGKLEVYDW